MKEFEFLEKKRLIQMTNYDCPPKDMIDVANIQDFEYLCNDFNCVYVIGDVYYLIGPDIVYTYKKRKEVKK